MNLVAKNFKDLYKILSKIKQLLSKKAIISMQIDIKVNYFDDIENYEKLKEIS